MIIKVGHSPDPDDAFMFYALAHKKIDARGFEVEHVIEDIESLNQRALKGELEVTAISCHAYAYLADKYTVMRSGSSVGDQYGPVLVRPGSVKSEAGNTAGASRNTLHEIRGKKIAIPGKLTTAYLVLQMFEKEFTPVFIPFDKILDAVKAGEVDLGLVIHEGQITYDQHGLEKVLDLGEWWHEKMQLPLPLGIDVIRKDLGQDTIVRFAGLFKESIEYALNHRKEALEYASQFGRGIPDDLNDRFVGMYVNDYTVELGEKGEAGFRKLLDEAYSQKIIPKKVNLEFI